MKDQLPALIIIIPLSMALLAPLVSFLSVRLLHLSVAGAILAAHLCSLAALRRTLTDGPQHYWFGGWEPPWGIEYVTDPLSAVIAVLITFIGFFVSVYSAPFIVYGVSWLRNGIIYSLYLLVITGLNGIVLT